RRHGPDPTLLERHRPHDLPRHPLQHHHPDHRRLPGLRRPLRHLHPRQGRPRPDRLLLHHVPVRQRLRLPTDGLRQRHGLGPAPHHPRTHRPPVPPQQARRLLPRSLNDATPRPPLTPPLRVLFARSRGPPVPMTNRSEGRLSRLIAFAILSIAALAFLTPLIWMIATSAKPETQAASGT